MYHLMNNLPVLGTLGVAALLAGPLAVSPAKAAGDLGWRPSRRSSEVLRDALAHQTSERYRRHVR